MGWGLITGLAVGAGSVMGGPLGGAATSFAINSTRAIFDENRDFDLVDFAGDAALAALPGGGVSGLLIGKAVAKEAVKNEIKIGIKGRGASGVIRNFQSSGAITHGFNNRKFAVELFGDKTTEIGKGAFRWATLAGAASSGLMSSLRDRGDGGGSGSAALPGYGGSAARAAGVLNRYNNDTGKNPSLGL